MKNLLKYFILTLVVFGCSDDNDEIDSQDVNQLSDLAVIELSQTPEVDYLVTLNSSSEFFIVESQGSGSSIPKKISYFNEPLNDYVNIFFDENGEIDKVVLEDHIFIFQNKDEFSFDLGIYTNSDEVLLFSNIESEFNWNNNALSRDTSTNFLNTLIESSSLALSGIQCVLASIQTVTGNISVGTFLSAFDCGLGIGDAIADVLVENGFQIYVDQEVIDNLDQFFEYYDAFSLWVGCIDITDVTGIRDCFLAVLSNVLSNIEEDEVFLNDNDEVVNDIEDSIDNLFRTQFIDFSNNEIPEGWEYDTVNSADISNERMNAYTNDGVSKLFKEGLIARNVNELKLEMDVYIAYSFWGLIYNFTIYSGDERIGFRTGQEDYEFPANSIANLINYYSNNENILLDSSLSAVEEGVYHVELIINQTSYTFRGQDELGNEVFSISIPLENYISLNQVDKIEFRNIANTNNNGWIDNISLSLN